MLKDEKSGWYSSPAEKSSEGSRLKVYEQSSRTSRKVQDCRFEYELLICYMTNEGEKQV